MDLGRVDARSQLHQNLRKQARVTAASFERIAGNRLKQCFTERRLSFSYTYQPVMRRADTKFKSECR